MEKNARVACDLNPRPPVCQSSASALPLHHRPGIYPNYVLFLHLSHAVNKYPVSPKWIKVAPGLPSRTFVPYHRRFQFTLVFSIRIFLHNSKISSAFILSGNIRQSSDKSLNQGWITFGTRRHFGWHAISKSVYFTFGI